MKHQPLVIAAACFFALVLGVGWAAFVWVPNDGSIWLWSESDGTLRAPKRGFRLAPRWSEQRLPASVLTAAVPTTTRDGVSVSAVVVLHPEGLCSLHSADSPEEGLRLRVADLAKRTVSSFEMICFLTHQDAESCPENPQNVLRAAVADMLQQPESSLEVRLDLASDSALEHLAQEFVEGLTLPKNKVLVLGLDGLDWDLVLPWVESGKMPNLKRLMDGGTWGIMKTIVPMLSPLIWTTMSTGVAPDVHGVLDFVEKDPATGQPVPVTGRSRKVPAIWNITSLAGLRTDVVGWWATWPAEKINGVMISDRLYYTLQQGIPKETFHQDPPDLVFPEDRNPEFIDIRDRAVRETDWKAIRYFMNITEAAFDAAVVANNGMEDPIDGLRRILSASRTYFGTGLALAEEKPDLLMVYIEGTDTIGHLLAPYMPPPTIDVSPVEAQVYAQAVPKYFEVVDRWIGRYLEHCPLSEYAVIMVSDHGFKWLGDRPTGMSGVAGPTAPMWHAEDAVFVVAGTGVANLGRVDTVPSVYGVAPTLAALLGIPEDESWNEEPFPGVAPTMLSPVQWMSLIPLESYTQSGGGISLVDQEYMDKLKALGYVGEDGTSAGEAARAHESHGRPAAGSKPTPTPQPATATRSQINNLALIKINQKDYEEAERLLREAIARSPDYAAPHFNLRRIYMETEQYEEADKELWIAVEKGLRDRERTLDRAAADYEALEHPERADQLLTRAIQTFPEHEPFYVHLMVVKLRTGRCPEALPVGAVAVERFPQSGPVHSFYGLAAACAGDAALARPLIERALEINPNQPQLREALKQLP